MCVCVRACVRACALCTLRDTLLEVGRGGVGVGGGGGGTDEDEERRGRNLFINVAFVLAVVLV